MKLNPKFWNDYPIFLSNEDYGQYEEDSEGSELTDEDQSNELGSNPTMRKASNTSKASVLKVGGKTMNVQDKTSIIKKKAQRENSK